MSESSPASLSERAILLLLAAVQFTHIMDFMVLMPLGPQLMRTFSIGPEEFSLLVASYTFSAAVAGLAGAFLIDRFDRKNALLFCYLGFLIGTVACALAPTYHALLLARIVSGAFGGVAGSVVLTIAGDVTPPERRAHGMGVVMASFSVASVAGVPVSLWLAAHLSWHAPFYIIASTGAVVWVVCFLRLSPLRAHLANRGEGGATSESLRGLKEILSSSNTRTALVLMVLMVLGHFIIIPFLSPSLVANVGLKEHELSWVYLTGGAVTLFSAPFIGRMADRHGRFVVFCVMILGSVAPVFVITHQGASPLWFVLVTAAVFFIFAGGRFIPGQAMMSSAVPARLRGTFMSLNSSVRDLGAGVASLIGGHIIVQEAGTGRLLHFPVLGWIAVATSLVSILVARKVRAVS